MQKLTNEYKRFIGFEPMPNESQCPECGYFDTTHPDVQRILHKRGNDDYWLMVAQCKCQAAAAAERSKQEIRRQQANVPYSTRERPIPERTFNTFNTVPGTADMLNACVQFSTGDGPPFLILMGNPGVGKSHMMEATVRATIARGRYARYEMVSNLLDRLRSCYDMDSEEDLMGLISWYQGRYLLALDDLGLEKGTDWAREKLTVLLEDRMRMGWRTIISTNLSRDEMSERLGERLASRLYATNPDIQSVKVVVVEADDYRSRQP